MSENEEKDLITMTDENGKEVSFEFLDTVEMNEKLYCVLEPVGASEEFEEGSCYIFQVKESDAETWDLIPVENEEEMNAVFAKFLENNSDEGCDGDCSGCSGCDDK